MLWNKTKGRTGGKRCQCWVAFLKGFKSLINSWAARDSARSFLASNKAALEPQCAVIVLRAKAPCVPRRQESTAPISQLLGQSFGAQLRAHRDSDGTQGCPFLAQGRGRGAEGTALSVRGWMKCLLWQLKTALPSQATRRNDRFKPLATFSRSIITKFADPFGCMAVFFSMSVFSITQWKLWVNPANSNQREHLLRALHLLKLSILFCVLQMQEEAGRRLGCRGDARWDPNPKPVSGTWILPRLQAAQGLLWCG